MSELSTTDIPGWVHTSLQGEEIFDATIPPELQLPADSTPVVINSEFADAFASSDRELFHVSSNHGRSYEMGPNVAARGTMARIALWRDEVGNPYTSFSLKGNNFSKATVMESSTAPSGYIPMGLLESDALLRVIRSSRMLRQAGISTEWISRVFEPKELIYKGELVSQEEYKRRILLDTANEKGIEEMVHVSAALEPMTFFITGRSMEINDRLADFAFDTTESAAQRVKHIFKVYNVTHKDDEDFRPLRYSRESDRIRFFKEIFPALLGTNLAKLHNIDLVHTFPTLSNVTILGGIIDLDSVRGVPLAMDDEPVGRADMVSDLATINDYDNNPSTEIKGLYRNLQRLGVIRNSGDAILAQHNVVAAYEGARTASRLKRDREIDQLYLSGVNHHLDGPKGWNAYMNLHKAESKKAAAMIWDLSLEKVDKAWSVENLMYHTNSELDFELQQITKGLKGVDDKAEFTSEYFQKLEKRIRRAAEIDAESPDEIAEFVEEHIADFPKIAALAPDPEIRLRVLRSLSTKVIQDVGDRMKKENDAVINANIKEAMDEIVDKRFLPHLTDDDWKPYVRHSGSFGDLAEKAAKDFRVLNQKVVYAYDNMTLEDVIKRAEADETPFALDPLPLYMNNYNFPEKGYVQRAVFSDGKNFRMQRIHFIDTDVNNDTIGIAINTDPDITYLAWICEPVSPSRTPVILIQHKDPELLKAMVAARR